MHTLFHPTYTKLVLLLFLVFPTIEQYPFVDASPLVLEQNGPVSRNAEATTLSGKLEPQPTSTASTGARPGGVALPEDLQTFARYFDGGARGSPVRGAQPEIDASQTQKNGTLVKKVDVPLSYFYDKRGLYVDCHSRRYIYERQPFTVPEFPEVKLRHWTDWKAKGDFSSVERYIYQRQHRCRACRCDEDGKMIPSEIISCRSPLTVLKCMIIMGCYCIANLVQPPPIEGATLSDYQQVLDRIPRTVRNRDRYYRWLFAGNSLGFRTDDLEFAPLGNGPLYIAGWENPETPGPDFEPAPEDLGDEYMSWEERNHEFSYWDPRHPDDPQYVYPPHFEVDDSWLFGPNGPGLNSMPPPKD
ncbi:hypothetical protein TWF718_006012 [Orbilia javanica]|uniref:Uncharacterized protein n=1 Tax=Orbilia javanica TaxID=47235 RepID=A0AAN8MZU2_9PEZI